MRFTRIVVGTDKSYLVYSRGLVFAMAPIVVAKRFRSYTPPLETAKRELRHDIQRERETLREGDKLKARETGAILNLLRRKRRAKADVALKSKRPVNKTRHVGVEIEFISKSRRHDIATTLAEYGVESFVELKADGSVHGDNDNDGDCNGDCRENCECSYCGETHYCDNERDCNQRTRNSEGRSAPPRWVTRDNCTDCTETETLDNCDCGGQDAAGDDVCNGEHIVCEGHCEGHSCDGYDDHPDYDCNCECDCNGGSDTGHEIAIVARSSQIADVVSKVCEALAEHDAKVNKTCGLHVHLDMRGVSNVEGCFSRLVKCQRLLYSMVPSSRHDNSYCRPNTPGWAMAEYTGRYWGINPMSFEEHGTLEVRLHSGTVNATKINNWIKVLQKIAYSKRRIKEPRTLADLSNAVNFGPELLDYITARITEFKSGHGSYSLPVEAPKPAPRFKPVTVGPHALIRTASRVQACLPF